jgi:hypothetical protein
MTSITGKNITSSGSDVKTKITANDAAYPQDISSRKVYTIKADNWDKIYPYYFAVVLADAKTGECIVSDNAVNLNKEFSNTLFELPINPTNLTISTPFAINVTPTTRGILEEHNGTIFRNIMISGTTGVTPGNLRKTSNLISGLATKGALALASNTISEVGSVLRATGKLIESASNKVPSLQSKVSTNIEEFGYAKLHALYNYFPWNKNNHWMKPFLSL